ncbi:DUF1508 domain-containing protein [Parabacteroides sp. 52]|uniref:YegP family protein n=1 Tax=Parabacteroides sp. 52 TaxID=2302940 RepID=UPI0013D1444C|nr:YegP family protein [Parabacteroides sp. 52]NDV55099.1 DUF1508 domain-containing protein [Parabacteroides sp. 52]
MAKFEITKRKNGEFQFNLKANNGEIILTSEGYIVKKSAIQGIASVKKNSQQPIRFEKKNSSNEKFFFNLRAGNNKVVGTSQMYKSEANRDKGIHSVMQNAPLAEIVDLTLD